MRTMWVLRVECLVSTYKCWLLLLSSLIFGSLGLGIRELENIE